MDALMAALLAALLSQPSDRTPWLAAILADRTQRPMAVLLGLALALAIVQAVAAGAGAWIGPKLSPNAQGLLLALALLSAAAAMVTRIKPPDRLEGWRLPPFLLAFLGLLILAAGDRTQFLTFALAARSPVPWLAAVGALIGALAVNVPMVLAGERARRRLPLTAARWAGAALFGIAGVAAGLSALRLV
jgi:Ca2+/H+ antiporter, TMEM165/GDT1 family